MSDADKMRNLLAFLLVGAFITVIPLFTYKALPVDSKDIVTYMIGQLSGMALMALGHFFTNRAGQDQLDEKRSETTGKLVDMAKAALNKDAPDVVLKPGETAQAEEK